MSKRDELLAEAYDLELEFKGNISNAKLEAMIAEAKGEPPPVDEAPPPGPAVAAEFKEDEDEDVREKVRSAAAALAAKRREKVADAKRKAMKKHVVTITNKDPRESNVATTAYLAFENQHFGMARLVPLDIPVELETALIEIAASCRMTLHKDEIVNGNRTGNKVPVRVAKYAISYLKKDSEGVDKE